MFGNLDPSFSSLLSPMPASNVEQTWMFNDAAAIPQTLQNQNHHHTPQLATVFQPPVALLPPPVNTNNAMQTAPSPRDNSSPSTAANSSQWLIQWFDACKKNQWHIGSPMFKYCKKRKEHYSAEISDTWYKAPYKYNMVLEVENMSENENVLALLELNYEDGQQVQYTSKNSATGKKNSKKRSTPHTPGTNQQNSVSIACPQNGLSSGVVSNNENYFTHTNSSASTGKFGIVATRSEVTIGPFQFNICSYKQDGRKFRMIIYLYTPALPNAGNGSSGGVQLHCCLVSPPFTIRAKKPIVSPGIKKNKINDGKKKRSALDNTGDEEEEEDIEEEEAPIEQLHAKRQKTMEVPQIVVPPKQGPVAKPLDMSAQSVTVSVISQPQLQQSILDDDYLHQQSVDLTSPTSLQVFGFKNDTQDQKLQLFADSFGSMSAVDRKNLLIRLMDLSQPHEKELIRRLFFEQHAPVHSAQAAAIVPASLLSNPNPFDCFFADLQ